MFIIAHTMTNLLSSHHAKGTMSDFFKKGLKASTSRNLSYMKMHPRTWRGVSSDGQIALLVMGKIWGGNTCDTSRREQMCK